MHRHRCYAGACLSGLLLAGCAGREPAPPASIRLVDLYRPELVRGRVAPGPTASRIEWRFAEAASGDTRGWKAGVGISGLAIRNGRLVGRTTGAWPMLVAELPPLPESDLVHEVEVRLRVSGGSRAAAVLRLAAPVDFPFEAELVRVLPWPLTSPLAPGEETRTYALQGASSVVTRGRRQLLLCPADRAGVDFEIESIRLVTRREHLEAVASGIGWQGLSEVYRESLVVRSPETIGYRLRLPGRPRLELAVGTVEEWPVRFRVSVAPAGSGEDRTVVERLVTIADRWEPLAVDLGRLAGREVELSLSVASDKPGMLGFWGSPIVRNLAGPAASQGGRPAAQGVILIWADTLRRDHLDVYGYVRGTAPAIRRLASEGALFRDCIAQAPWTKVSGPSILTSLYPSTHGIRDIPDRLPGTATTLAESFREAGWATLALSSIAFVGKMTNLQKGFEEFHEPTSIPIRDVSTKTARTLVDRLLPWLEAHREVPFFVLLHVADPHSPFRPDPPYDSLWADPARREEHERQARAVRPLIANPNLRRLGMPNREELVRAGVDPDLYVAHERDWYDGAIREMDAEIGRLRERLAELGLGRVVVAFTSDHGEELLDHGSMFHGQSVYGELTNVPLVLWGPGIVPPGLVVDGAVQLIDVMPTLLELAGLRPPPGIQGRSLVAALGTAPSRGGLEPRPAIAENPSRGGAVVARRAGSIAVFSDGWKLIRNAQWREGLPEFELYDHRADPLDRTDLAPRHPEVVARLARDLAAWQTVAEKARLKPDTQAAAALGKEELERLRALGYIQ